MKFTLPSCSFCWSKALAIVVAIWCAVICQAVFAQDSAERIDRTIEQLNRQTQAQVDTELPLSQRALVDYGGYATYSYLSFDDSVHNNHGLNNFEVVGYGRVNFDGANELYFRGRANYLDYNPGDSPDGHPNHLDGRVEEAWYRFDLANFATAHHREKPRADFEIKAGRQFVAWGMGLTLDQYADGISAQIKTNHVNLDLLAAVTIRQTIDFDTSRPDLNESTERGFYGAKVTVPVGRQNPYAYILVQRDYNRGEPLDAHVLPTRYRYNSYYAGLGMNGPINDQFTYGAEFCFEGGRGLSNSYNPADFSPVRQTGDPIEAYAGDARVDYLPGDVHRSRFGIEGIIASGDRDRVTTSATFGGNRPHTGDHAFNALGDLDTGLAFAASLSNLMVVRLSASTYPFPQGSALGDFQAGADFLVYGKTTIHAPIDEATTTSRYLGCEPDIFVNWRVTEDVTCILRYGVFVPGSAIPDGQPNFIRQFLYAGVTYAF
jgi:hypothetical protein